MAPNQIVHSLVNYCFENSKISNTPNYYCLKTHYCLKYLKYLIYTLLFLAKHHDQLRNYFLLVGTVEALNTTGFVWFWTHICIELIISVECALEHGCFIECHS